MVKIADLGLARVLGEVHETRLTRTGCLVGTPLYIAPEYIRDPDCCSPASDIYALGASMYHAISGHPPFAGISIYKVLQAHLDEPVPAAPPCPGLDPGLASLLQRCLEKDPAQRPTTAELIVRASH